ncbi:hypothetical protein FPOAC2_04530 [Fusarium poae]
MVWFRRYLSSPKQLQNSITARHSTPTHDVVTSARPVLALAQTPPSKASPSSKPIAVQKSTSTQKPVLGQTQQSQKPVPSQQTLAAPKSSTQQPAIIQKPVTTRPSSQKPATAEQPDSIAKLSPTQKPAPT